MISSLALTVLTNIRNVENKVDKICFKLRNGKYYEYANYCCWGADQTSCIQMYKMDNEDYSKIESYLRSNKILTTYACLCQKCVLAKIASILALFPGTCWRI